MKETKENCKQGEEKSRGGEDREDFYGRRAAQREAKIGRDES